MFVDRAKITVHGGCGGNGCVSFDRQKFKRVGPPNGGHGGDGGSIVVRADRNLATLSDYIYQPMYRADSGGHGSSNNKHGRNGKDVVLRVPVGTLVRERDSEKLLGDLAAEDAEIVVAQGGHGGRGNSSFKSSTNRSPKRAEPGAEGETVHLAFELKILADIGLVGYPNAGKSTLVSAITHAHSRIASYPFTTLQPILGLLELPEYRTAVIADIPGIIEGAHRNIGLGHAFLRHIERCTMLIVLIDMGGVDQRNPCDDYRVMCEELEQYSYELSAKPHLVLANKMDLVQASDNLAAFRTCYADVEVLPISALEGLGLDELLGRILEMLKERRPGF
jgi:GTP-binding protein